MKTKISGAQNLLQQIEARLSAVISSRRTDSTQREFFEIRACRELSRDAGGMLRQIDTKDTTAELLATLELINSNAAESAEWVRRVASAAIAKAKDGA